LPDRTRVAIVGLGNAGSGLHLPALAGMTGARAVGGFDLDPDRRSQVRERWRVPVYDSFEALLDDARPELVVVGTPPDSHAEYVIRSLEAGAHVLCEKPFVSTLAEADEIVAVAERTGRRVALNHEFREMPIFRALLDQVGRPEVGELVFAQVWQLMDLPPWAEPGWRGRLLQRTLYEAGVHLVDFVMALFGEKPVAVSATTSTCGVRDADSDAVALVTLEFSRGRLVQIIQNRLCRGETQYFEVRAEGTAASLRASFGGRARVSVGLHRSTRPHLRLDVGTSGIAWREVGNRRTLLARNPRDPGIVATRHVLERTLAAFRDGSEPPASARAGRDVLEVIAACYHSARTGQRVQLNAETEAALRTLHLGAAPAIA
jgi:predicted dehydrogenase